MTNKIQLPFSDEQIQTELSPFGFTPDLRQLGLIRQYFSSLVFWNHMVSLTSIRDPSGILKRHFGESFWAVKTVPIRHGRLADLGSGAGFPGLVLKIACPELEVILIEPNRKKAAFLAEVKRVLAFDRVQIVGERYEAVCNFSNSLDYVTARAIGKLPEMLRWALGTLKPSGRVVFWLGSRSSSTASQTIGWSWRAPVLIPQSERRVLLIGSPSCADE